MNRTVALLLVLLTASVGACGHEAQTAAPADAPAGAAAPPAAASAPAMPAPGLAAASAPAAEAGAGEPPGDTADDAPEGTTSLEHLAQLPPQHQLPDGRWKPGINYDPVVPAQSTGVPAGKVEVLEVFWYACPHCYALEPYLVNWLKTKPDYVQFVRVPVMWGPVHRAHAQLYQTLQALGRNDLDDKVFETIHSQQNLLVGNTPEDTFNKQLQFATESGISADSFRKTFNSPAVIAGLEHAQEINQRYHAESVPLIIINGKYATDVARAGSHEDLIALINDLAASEHHR